MDEPDDDLENALERLERSLRAAGERLSRFMARRSPGRTASRFPHGFAPDFDLLCARCGRLADQHA
jgi:hypothetical protein